MVAKGIKAQVTDRPEGGAPRIYLSIDKAGPPRLASLEDSSGGTFQSCGKGYRGGKQEGWRDLGPGKKN